MKLFIVISAFLVFSGQVFSQVGIGIPTPHSSAMLEINSPNKGFLAPRMNSTIRTGIPSPAAGLFIFDTTTDTYWYYNGTAWVNLAGGSGSSPWTSNGNYIYHLTDSLGLGTSSPDEKMHISNGQLRLSRTASYENKIIFSMPASSLVGEHEGLKFQLAGVDKSFIGYTSTSTSGNFLRLSGNGINANDLVITAEGDVGIGTNIPEQKLHVAGNIKGTGSIFAEGSISSSSALSTSGNIVASGTGYISGLLTTNTGLTINDPAGIVTLKNSTDKGFVQLSGDDLRIGTFSSNSTGNLIFRLNGNNRVVVNPSGDVDIDGKITSNAKTGSLNLVPICLGRIGGDGSIRNGSGNFTVSKINTGLGHYELTCSSITANAICLATSEFNTDNISMVYKSGTTITIRCFNTNTKASIDSNFSFVIYQGD